MSILYGQYGVPPIKHNSYYIQFLKYIWLNCFFYTILFIWKYSTTIPTRLLLYLYDYNAKSNYYIGLCEGINIENYMDIFDLELYSLI